MPVTQADSPTMKLSRGSEILYVTQAQLCLLTDSLIMKLISSEANAIVLGHCEYKSLE